MNSFLHHLYFRELFFAALGGKDLNEAMHRMLRSTGTGHVFAQFSLHGLKGKKAFGNYRLAKIMIGMLHIQNFQHYRCRLFLLFFFNSCISNWTQRRVHCNDREGVGGSVESVGAVDQRSERETMCKLVFIQHSFQFSDHFFIIVNFFELIHLCLTVLKCCYLILRSSMTLRQFQMMMTCKKIFILSVPKVVYMLNDQCHIGDLPSNAGVCASLVEYHKMLIPWTARFHSSSHEILYWQMTGIYHFFSLC